MIMLADARAIPLKDKSVQCVVTSPPYWGLRDYGIAPSIWGGNPNCDHEWGELQHGKKQTGGLGASETFVKGSGLTPETVKAKKLAQSHDGGVFSFCLKCGAWLGCLGLEPTPELYVEHIVQVFREVARVLKDDGTIWVNLGDCYTSGGGKVGDHPGGGAQGARCKGETSRLRDEKGGYRGDHARDPKRNSAAIPLGPNTQPNRMPIAGLKPKDLVGIPWRVAFALQADGWYLRSDIIWSKPNPMPESVADRPTKAHEYIFLLVKSGSTTCWLNKRTRKWVKQKPKPHWSRSVVNGKVRWSNLWQGRDYFFDQDAVREPHTPSSILRLSQNIGDQVGSDRANGGAKTNGTMKAVAVAGQRSRTSSHLGSSIPWEDSGVGRNIRTVWEIATQPFSEAHFATFPQKLAERCVKAGSKPGDVVFDPFGGSGTVVKVAQDLGRVGIAGELNPEYLRIAKRRTSQQGFGLLLRGIDGR